jgi:hypothetical protein
VAPWLPLLQPVGWRLAVQTDQARKTTNIDRDLSRTIIHEGFHTLPGEIVFVKVENLRYPKRK